MIIGIILAAGKGTRLKSKDTNKVTLPFLNRPMITYGVDLMKTITDKTIVVVGAFGESVKQALKGYEVSYAFQKEQHGTGHAVQVAVEYLNANNLVPELVLVGYGDHTMFYKEQTIRRLIQIHTHEKSTISCISVEYDNPNKLAWGRIIRDNMGNVIDIIEQKDASDEQLEIKEINAGFYCFDFQFLKDNVNQLPRSSISGEYYINSLIKMAVQQGKRVSALKVLFDEVGVGINRQDEIKESEKIYLLRG